MTLCINELERQEQETILSMIEYKFDYRPILDRRPIGYKEESNEVYYD